MKMKLEAASDYHKQLTTIWGSCDVGQGNLSIRLDGRSQKLLVNHALLLIPQVTGLVVN